MYWGGNRRLLGQIHSRPHHNNFFFRIYDIDNDGYISNGELFQVLKMMVGSNLKDTQLQQIVDKTILFADKVSKCTEVHLSTGMSV